MLPSLIIAGAAQAGVQSGRQARKRRAAEIEQLLIERCRYSVAKLRLHEEIKGAAASIFRELNGGSP